MSHSVLVHGWKDGDSGGTAADDDDLLVDVIKVFWPELRVYDLS